MIACPSCAAEIENDDRFCPRCGSSLDPTEAATRARDEHAGTIPSAAGPNRSENDSLRSSRNSPRSRPTGHESTRFPPGTVLDGRYQILELIGRGGMGEVYKAKDLRLEQTVALKFLPGELGSDPSRLSRFFSEVRIARQVSHPNVCRVHDLGEWDGLHFISMEYVDGEDLRSLLRRIGRLPKDKALDIARQLCAGLVAAHKRGVLHRDLKPANIMLDGSGQVCITDFGLAAVAGEVQGSDIRSGTPTYMSPEQLEGQGVDRRSDVFALGLVLYEVFTGRQVFEAKTLEELSQLHSVPRVSPREVIGELDPSVEQVILKCLERDPQKRPDSALAVAAALPGGDPLQAALEAGETPSPDLVAASGTAGRMRPLAGLLCLAAVLVGLIFTLFLSRMSLLGYVPLEHSPEILADKARTILAGFGYEEEFGDEAHGLYSNNDYLRYIRQHDKKLERWERLRLPRPAGIVFWYRQSPRALASRIGSRVSWSDPPFQVTGMKSLRLGPDGKLLEFKAVPVPAEGIVDESQPDWKEAFEVAGLQIGEFSETESGWVPPVYADGRKTWEGSYPQLPGERIRIEAGSHLGKLVYFKVFEPWTREERITATPRTLSQSISLVVALSIISLIIGGSLILGRHNLKKGRGDVRGAYRVAASLFLLMVLRLLFRRNWIAVAFVFALGVLSNVLQEGEISTSLVPSVILMALVWCLVVVSMLRFGLIAGMATLFTANWILTSPTTADVSAFYFGSSLFTLLVVLAIAGYGFAASLDRSAGVFAGRLEELS